MSYILDALNKAEKARQQSAEPAIHQSDKVPPVSGQKPVASLYFAVLVLLVIAGVWLMPEKEIRETIAPVPPSLPTNTAPASHASTNPKAVTAEDTQAAITTTPSSKTSAQTTSVPPLLSLPEDILNALPPITISAHNFSENTTKSMVILNNKLLHEGAHIQQDLILQTITEQGVILEFQGYTFSMAVQDIWPL